MNDICGGNNNFPDLSIWYSPLYFSNLYNLGTYSDNCSNKNFFKDVSFINLFLNVSESTLKNPTGPALLY